MCGLLCVLMLDFRCVLFGLFVDVSAVCSCVIFFGERVQTSAHVCSCLHTYVVCWCCYWFVRCVCDLFCLLLFVFVVCACCLFVCDVFLRGAGADVCTFVQQFAYVRCQCRGFVVLCVVVLVVVVLFCVLLFALFAICVSVVLGDGCRRLHMCAIVCIRVLCALLLFVCTVVRGLCCL